MAFYYSKNNKIIITAYLESTSYFGCC